MDDFWGWAFFAAVFLAEGGALATEPAGLGADVAEDLLAGALLSDGWVKDEVSAAFVVRLPLGEWAVRKPKRLPHKPPVM